MMVQGDEVQLEGDVGQRPEKLDLDQTQKLELLLQVCTTLQGDPSD